MKIKWHWVIGLMVTMMNAHGSMAVLFFVNNHRHHTATILPTASV